MDFIKKRSFEPFRVHMTDKRAFDLMHPEQAMVTHTRLVVPVDYRDGVPARLENSLL